MIFARIQYFAVYPDEFYQVSFFSLEIWNNTLRLAFLVIYKELDQDFLQYTVCPFCHLNFQNYWVHRNKLWSLGNAYSYHSLISLSWDNLLYISKEHRHLILQWCLTCPFTLVAKSIMFYLLYTCSYFL